MRSTHHRGCRCVTATIVLMVAIDAGAGGVVSAQSVDIAEELQEEAAPKEPLVQVHPWRWFRSKWLQGAALLERRLGLQVGSSFTTIYQHAAGLDSPNNACVSSLDLYGRWRLVDLGPLGVGTAGVLFRNRSNYADLNGNDLSAAIGLPWGISNSGSTGYARFNQLWWEQSLLRQMLVVKFGKLDEPSLFDQNRVAASDARQFLMQSLVHSQTIAFPNNGLGINARYAPSDRVYMTAGFGDANGDPDRAPSDSLSSFGKGKYFEAAEVGVSPDLSALSPAGRQGTYRLTGWHVAQTSTHPTGSGIAMSVDQEVGTGIVPFLRFGYSPDDVFKTSLEVSWGVEAERPFDRITDRAGLAASWGKQTTSSGRDQFAMEAFYRIELVEGVAISPDVELIFAPALQPNRDFVAVLGLRTRLSL